MSEIQSLSPEIASRNERPYNTVILIHMSDTLDTKLILVTCTYQKPNRIRFLRRCIRTFRHLSNMLWIVVEDAHSIDLQVKGLLEASGMQHIYLNTYSRSFGNAQKNLGLTYIRDSVLKGIVYMADDDNRYDIRLFDEIRKTKRISVFPVGNLGPNAVERPVVKKGKIIGWDADWLSRKFPLDLAGFAFNAELLQALEDPIWPHTGYGGETEFIEKLIDSPAELEILCNHCRSCYVWHNYPLLPRPLGNTLIRLKSFKRKLKTFLIR